MGGSEASGEEAEGGQSLCLHYFFGSTEKQDVKDLPGLPRNRDPGEVSWRCVNTGVGSQAGCWVGWG